MGSTDPAELLPEGHACSWHRPRGSDTLAEGGAHGHGAPGADDGGAARRSLLGVLAAIGIKGGGRATAQGTVRPGSSALRVTGP